MDNLWISIVEMWINFEDLPLFQIAGEVIHGVLHKAGGRRPEAGGRRIWKFIHIYTGTTNTRD